MRLLFLDFDGVLHPADADPALAHFCWLPELERLLSSHTDVRIVVHSTWRYDHHDSELRALLAGLGARFVGSAPRGPRQQAIESVLQSNKGKVSNYLVLDDASNEFEEGTLNVVLLDGRAGISDLDAQAVVAEWLASSTPNPS
jgi:hypothetical protein